MTYKCKCKGWVNQPVLDRRCICAFALLFALLLLLGLEAALDLVGCATAMLTAAAGLVKSSRVCWLGGMVDICSIALVVDQVPALISKHSTGVFRTSRAE